MIALVKKRIIGIVTITTIILLNYEIQISTLTENSKAFKVRFYWMRSNQILSSSFLGLYWTFAFTLNLK